MVKHKVKPSLGPVLCLLLLLTACANFSAVDKPISQVTPLRADQIVSKRSSDLLVLVGFSGGGTRAAAFAYGVLKTLANTEITTDKGQRSLLHEVDVISSVSGGSFTSDYYGLRGDKIFEEFDDRFLRKNLEAALIWKVLSPVNWIPQMSSIYGRGDVVAEYYSKHIFDGATFADLKRPGAPAVVINATDLAPGMRFAITPAYFNLICTQAGKVTSQAGGPGACRDDRSDQLGSDRPLQLRHSRYRALLL